MTSFKPNTVDNLKNRLYIYYSIDITNNQKLIKRPSRPPYVIQLHNNCELEGEIGESQVNSCFKENLPSYSKYIFI